MSEDNFYKALMFVSLAIGTAIGLVSLVMMACLIKHDPALSGY